MVDLRNDGIIGIEQIVDKEHIAHLFAVAIDRDWSPLEGSNNKPGQPPLILDPKLAIAIDATLPHDDRAQVVYARIVAHILIAGPLGTAIRGMKIERLRFRDPMWEIAIVIALFILVDRYLFHAAVDFVGAGVEDDRIVGNGACCFQHIECTQRIRFKILTWVFHRGRHRYLTRQVINPLRVDRGPL